MATSTDATGALLAEGNRTYVYDAIGLLAEVDDPGGQGVRYQRDGLGRIVAELDLATSELTRLGWDGEQQVLARHSDGTVETTIAAEGLDEPVVTMFPNGGRRYYHQDRQGSVYLTTTVGGAIDQWLSYSAYGEVSAEAGHGAIPLTAVSSRFGYHGLPHDFARGLVDMRARTYRPALGRFLSPDPIGLAGGASLFAFVDSAPLAYRDPFGLAKEHRNATGDVMVLANDDAFIRLRDADGTETFRFWSGVDGRWRTLSQSGWQQQLAGALDWDAHPEKRAKHEAIVDGLRIIEDPVYGARFACSFHGGCNALFTAGEIYLSDDDASCDFEAGECGDVSMRMPGPPGGAGGPLGAGRGGPGPQAPKQTARGGGTGDSRLGRLGEHGTQRASRPPPASDNYRGRYNANLAAQGKTRLPDGWEAHHRIPRRYETHPAGSP